MNACMRRIQRCLYVPVLLLSTRASAQNIRPITLAQADSSFLASNLYLISAKYDINIRQALEIQSRSYPNPAFSADINARDPQNSQWFHAGATGSKSFGIEQLIILGGKRMNEIELAKQNTHLAELEMEELLRNLRLELHTDFYGLYFDGLILQKYDEQLAVLDSLIANYEIQARKGNISLKEVVRLKSVYLRLNNDKSDLLQNIRQQQKDLHLLLQTDDDLSPVADQAAWNNLNHIPPLDSLLTLAYANRADWKRSELAKAISSLNIRYQKSLAIPDLTLGANYDQRGGAFNNQVNMTVGVPLPLWNRNRGNIRAAEFSLQQAASDSKIQSTIVSAEVGQAWYNMQRSMQEYQKSGQYYNEDFGDVFNGIVDNFRKRNISMIEFIDFFESYNESLADVNRIRKQLLQSAETVNHTVATIVYPSY